MLFFVVLPFIFFCKYQFCKNFFIQSDLQMGNVTEYCTKTVHELKNYNRDNPFFSGQCMWEVIKSIKENTKRTLKTAMAPWAEECSVPLDEVQCKLYLQYLSGSPRNELLDDYKGLFEGKGNWGEEGESEEMEIQRICDALSNGRLQGQKKMVLITGNYGTG